MAFKENVIIIGAGPAGLTAAIVLRKHGFPVTLYEQFPDVGHRLTGDFQGLENWSSESDVTQMLRDIGVEINFLCVPHTGGTIYAPGMDPVEMRSKKPFYYLIQRGPMPGAFDAALKEQALSLGVDMRFNRRVENFDERAIVGTGPKRADAIVLGMTFTTDLSDKAVLAFDDNIAPKGYAYLLVNKGLGTMATVLYRGFSKGAQCLNNTMKYFAARGEIDLGLDIINGRKFGGHVNFFLRDTQVRDEKLYVGEAAGFQDCLWGFGLRHAMLSGYLAARSFIDGSDYDVLWRKELKPLLRTSLTNRYLFEMFGHRGYRYLARKFTDTDPRGFLRKHYIPSFIKRLVLPLARRNYERRVKAEAQQQPQEHG